MTMMRFATILLGAGALGSALNAGVFLAFSAFVMPALDRLPARQAADAMRSINMQVLQSAFMPLFLGTAVIAAVLLVGSPWMPSARTRWLVMLAALLFLAGGFILTIAANVPLNERLSGFEGEAAAAYWPTYRLGWTFWNTARTLCCGVAAGMWITAVSSGNE